jgi:hypothetical protein
MEVKERSWKNFLVERKFQLKFMGYFLLLFVLSTASLYTTTFLFFWNLKKKGLSVGIPEGHVYYQFLLNQKSDLDLLFIALAGLNLVLLFIVGFIISHRIAGPIAKLKKFLQDPHSEDNFKLRENDFFKELGPLASKFKDKIK